MGDGKNRVCPLSLAKALDSRIRRWLQEPGKILGPHIRKGMTVLDLGCGPGYFTLEIARMVGESGRVVAADLQEGMLRKVKNKIRGTGLEERVTLHKCAENRIGLSDYFDFILAFYMIHEIAEKKALFTEIASILKPGGQLFIVEPSFHVSEAAFEETIRIAHDAGFESVQRPKMFLSKSVIFKKASRGAW
jgi:ubiquinone/menaquinone biosynthesis C-methylase UbiE